MYIAVSSERSLSQNEWSIYSARNVSGARISDPLFETIYGHATRDVASRRVEFLENISSALFVDAHPLHRAIVASGNYTLVLD